MSLLLLAGMLLGGLPTDPVEGPAALVPKLGAARYNDRESAEKALLSQGVAALPELRAAVKRTSDPEVRSRASELIAKIENAAMLQPTRVRFAYNGASAPEILKDLSAQSGIPLSLDWDDAPTDPAGDSLQFHAAEPIPFWEAVDRLSAACGLRVNFGPDHGINNRGFGLGVRLSPTPSNNRAPVSLSGPFRLKIDSIHLQRDRHFDLDIAPEDDEQFYAVLQLMAEPRLLVRQRGAIRVLEAVDDLGQNLTAPTDPDTDLGDAFVLDAPFEANESPRIDVNIPLTRPERTGSRVRSLKGTLPLHVVSRRDDPLEIPLEGSVGKTFSNGELTFTVREVSHDPIEPETSVLLGVKRRDGGEDPAGDHEDRIALSLASQFDSRDARGRHLETFAGDFVPAGAVAEGEFGVNVSITGDDDGGVGPPSHLRIYSLNHADVDVPFSFRDIPMP